MRSKYLRSHEVPRRRGGTRWLLRSRQLSRRTARQLRLLHRLHRPRLRVLLQLLAPPVPPVTNPPRPLALSPGRPARRGPANRSPHRHHRPGHTPAQRPLAPHGFSSLGPDRPVAQQHAAHPTPGVSAPPHPHDATTPGTPHAYGPGQPIRPGGRNVPLPTRVPAVRNHPSPHRLRMSPAISVPHPPWHPTGGWSWSVRLTSRRTREAIAAPRTGFAGGVGSHRTGSRRAWARVGPDPVEPGFASCRVWRNGWWCRQSGGGSWCGGRGGAVVRSTWCVGGRGWAGWVVSAGPLVFNRGVVTVFPVHFRVKFTRLCW